MKNIFLIVISLIILSSCEGDPKEAVKKLTATELKDELRQLEYKTPLAYISTKLEYFTENNVLVRAGGIFRDAEYATDGWNIMGSITNTALLANFKDIVLTVSYYSQTKSLIEKKDIIVYEYLKANSSIIFKSKVFPPEGTESIDIEVKAVSPADANLKDNLQDKLNKEMGNSTN